VVRSAIFLFLLMAGTAGAQGEPVRLAWDLPKDTVLSIGTETTVRTETRTRTPTGATEVSSEETIDKTTTATTVDAVGDGGRMALRTRLVSLASRRTSGSETLTLSGRGRADGPPEITVETSEENPAFRPEEAREVLAKFIEGLFACRWEAELTPRGEVAGATVTGDPYVGVPDRSFVGRAALRVARTLLPPEDAAHLLGAELFSLLPGGPVRTGESWAVSRRVSFLGLEMTGEGRAELVAVEGEAGDRVAEIREETTYRITASGLSERVAAALVELHEEMGLSTELSVSIEDPAPVVVSSTTRFAIGAGHASETAWPEFVVPLRGEMRLTLLGETSRFPLEITVRVSGRVSFERR
jgi:hypothetical protein